MVAFRIGTVRVGTLDDERFAALLDAAAQVGSAEAYPILFSLLGPERAVDPLALLDELGRLSKALPGTGAAALAGILRDDLLDGLAALGEG
ncbi:MAG: hypothetical protein IT305_06890 [Chloroflexi bacterium]|nr:hypothetical protein [Chloroflexota bacterium]